MTTADGNNSEDVLTLFSLDSHPRSTDRRIMFRTFGGGKNQSLYSSLSACIWFNLFFLKQHSTVCVLCVCVCVCVCVWVCVLLPLQNMFAMQTKGSQNPCTISAKTETKNKHISLFFFLQVLRILFCICIDIFHLIQSLTSPINLTYPRERVQMFHFFLYTSEQGHWAVTNAFHMQVEAWVWTDLNWCYSRRNQCIFLTAAITPLTSIHQEICMR